MKKEVSSFFIYYGIINIGGSMKKILITCLDLHYNKINNAMLEFINCIDLTKNEVDLIAMETGELLLQLDKRINVTYYRDYMLMPSKFLYNLKKKYIVDDLYNQQRFAFKKEYDIAISYYGHNNYVDMISASVKAKKKIIWVHNTIGEVSNYYRKKLIKKYKYFDNIVFTTKNNMNIFNNALPCYKDKTICINNVIDGNKVINSSKENTTIKLSQDYNIINISNLNKENNIDKLIDIQKYLFSKGKNVKIYVIGDGSLSYEIAEKMRKNNLTDSFIMLGMQKNPYNILKQANLYIDVSSSDKFNITLLESVVLDVPFIANETVVNKEILSIIPKNGGKVCNIENMGNEIIKQMKTYQDHIPFDYKKYEDDIIEKINKLLK
ncbi:MAG: glycosyltransferase [Bacilli bacterium]|nr:glycosyltransferase [Bacilli bacterium]